MVKVRVMMHPLVLSRCVTFVVTAVQTSVAETSALMLASVGRVGLQPRLLPVGTYKLGGVVSDVQV